MKKLEKLFLLSPFLRTSCMNTSVKVSEIREISLDEFNIEETKLNNAKKSMVYLEENKINGLHYCGVTISSSLGPGRRSRRSHALHRQSAALCFVASLRG